MPATIGMVLSSDKATLAELGSSLGVRDLYDLVEIVLIDAHNARVAQKAAKRNAG